MPTKKQKIEEEVKEIRETLRAVRNYILTGLLFLFLIFEIVGGALVLLSMEGAYEPMVVGIAIKKPLEVFALIVLLLISLSSTICFFIRRYDD